MSRITMTSQQLAQSLLIWIRLAPRRIWRKSEDYGQLKADKRHDPQDAPDPHRDLADYLADRVAQAGWEVSHPEPRNHG